MFPPLATWATASWHPNDPTTRRQRTEMWGNNATNGWSYPGSRSDGVDELHLERRRHHLMPNPLLTRSRGVFRSHHFKTKYSVTKYALTSPTSLPNIMHRSNRKPDTCDFEPQENNESRRTNLTRFQWKGPPQRPAKSCSGCVTRSHSARSRIRHETTQPCSNNQPVADLFIDVCAELTKSGCLCL